MNLLSETMNLETDIRMKHFIKYCKQSRCQLLCCPTLDVANIFSALHVLFDIEWAYGLRPTMKDGEVCLPEEASKCRSLGPQEDLLISLKDG